MSWLALTAAIACGIVIGRQTDRLIGKYLSVDEDAQFRREELFTFWKGVFRARR